MFFGSANVVAVVALVTLADGRLLGRQSPLVHYIPQTEAPVFKCPQECECQPGAADNGGMDLVSGMCHGYASEELSGARFCGFSKTYWTGDFRDCTQCSRPKFFGSHYELYQPTGVATGSVILLAPWNGTLGWGRQWVTKNMELVAPSIRQHSRILDVKGRPMPGKGFSAWYGYADDSAWQTEDPIAADVSWAVSYVHSLIEQEFKIVGDYRRITVFGLSQGANLALESVIRFPRPLGLVVSERGVLLPSRRANMTHRTIAATPYVLTIGAADHYYHENVIRECSSYLHKLGASVFMKTIQGLDHYKWNNAEWQVALNAVAAAQSGNVLALYKLAQVTKWTVAQIGE